MATAATQQLVCVDDFEKYAERVLPRNAFDYYRSGADDQITLKDNLEAFKRYRIYPRVLRDVSTRSTATTILGHYISMPICIAPTAMHRMAHPDGEIATARGAAALATAFTLSTISTSSIEEVAAGAPNSLRFFQLYIYRERDLTIQLINRVERAGFSALVLTVDTPFFGKRRADNRNKFKLPSHLKMANFEALDFKGSGMNEAKNSSGLNEYASSLFDSSLTWKDVDWLRTVTRLPIVIKGILTAEDAIEAVKHGVAGILVSNHGARQLDTVPATIDVLGEVVAAVGGRCEVYLDGGIRTGTDVFKALALGARAVFIGRPILYGLACNGENGVQQVLQILKDEFSTALALAGCASVDGITSSYIRQQLPVPSSKL